MDIYFLLQVISQYYFILFLSHSSFGHWEVSQLLPLPLSHTP